MISNVQGCKPGTYGKYAWQVTLYQLSKGYRAQPSDVSLVTKGLTASNAGSIADSITFTKSQQANFYTEPGKPAPILLPDFWPEE